MNFLFDLPPQLATMILAMLPVTELRFSIPFALKVLHLPIWEAMFWSILGDIIPALLIIYFVGPVSKFLRRKSKIADRFFHWLFAKTRRKFDKGYADWGKIALMFFVAIPLPGTGSWTGSIAAWLFDINKKESVIYIGLGVILSAIIVTLISLGVFSFIN